MAASLPDYPAQNELAPTAWAAAFSSLILEIEGEPGHYVDLSRVLEFDDTADDETPALLLTLAAPHFEEPGPHALVLRGESRLLALKYLRFRSRLTRELLMALPD